MVTPAVVSAGTLVLGALAFVGLALCAWSAVRWAVARLPVPWAVRR
jgi:hypothetical protein